MLSLISHETGLDQIIAISSGINLINFNCKVTLTLYISYWIWQRIVLVIGKSRWANVKIWTWTNLKFSLAYWTWNSNLTKLTYFPLNPKFKGKNSWKVWETTENSKKPRLLLKIQRNLNFWNFRETLKFQRNSTFLKSQTFEISEKLNLLETRI